MKPNNTLEMKNRKFYTEKPWFLGVLLAGLIGGVFLISGFVRVGDKTYLCGLSGSKPRRDEEAVNSGTPIQLNAILHYATSTIVPQQSISEIRISFDVLRSRSPCNFLVFGLGYDSMMWASFNPGGKTLFLEEDPDWVRTVLSQSPDLRAHHVKYRTKLSEADELIRWYRTEPDCSPSRAYVRGNERCKLALTGLPEEVYETEWDLIMVDAPKGYFAEAPGRMGAIFSAAVMARRRKGSGTTHVFLHDVDRKVEKMYAQEFLCNKYKVNGSGRLWHFEIPAAANMSDGGKGSRFC